MLFYTMRFTVKNCAGWRQEKKDDFEHCAIWLPVRRATRGVIAEDAGAEARGGGNGVWFGTLNHPRDGGV